MESDLSHISHSRLILKVTTLLGPFHLPLSLSLSFTHTRIHTLAPLPRYFSFSLIHTHPQTNFPLLKLHFISPFLSLTLSSYLSLTHTLTHTHTHTQTKLPLSKLHYMSSLTLSLLTHAYLHTFSGIFSYPN